MSRRVTILLAVAFVALTAGLVLAILVPGHDSSASGEHHNRTAFLALIPIYTALIPIFIANRRRKACSDEKKNG